MSVHSNYYEDEDEYRADLAFEYRNERGSTGWVPIGIQQRPHVDSGQMTIEDWLEENDEEE